MLLFRSGSDRDLGLALTRDGNATKAMPTLMRYRGAALAEFMRCLRTLQALQAEARAKDLAAPARRRRGRPIVPAQVRKTDRVAPVAPCPAPTAKDNRANPPAPTSAPQPVRLATAAPDLAVIPPALTALLAATERTRGSLLDQRVDPWRST